MKFSKQFSAYVDTQKEAVPGLSYVEFKRLKKMLKQCLLHQGSLSPSTQSHQCPPYCAVCDQTFFSVLMKEVEEVLGGFNDRVRRLLQAHLASGIKKYILRLRYGPDAQDHHRMLLEGQKLVTYIYMNAVAIRKILKKYDKIHLSKRGRDFRNRLQTLHSGLLQSPWLIELIALHLNLEENEGISAEMSAKFTYNFEGSKPTITTTLSNAVAVEFDLACPICLELVFDPVSLGCGHVFCSSCACSAASVPTIEGVKSADRSAKCPLCREVRVYEDAMRLTELDTLIRTRCKDYWEDRLQRERIERVEQAKKHWNEQCRAALGI
ncbi:hypothetical protein KP509_36G012200 [Ceratopteris richardii]|uniref:RING-type E3 ubiquitin transferase n=2 Tax=Ceratopteris richardii TaxID=49495 RepID=A0A8T2Q9G6_CERRI|nr:hypothetical protein KP509_36G012200 [Ceratopteris richardii]